MIKASEARRITSNLETIIYMEEMKEIEDKIEKACRQLYTYKITMDGVCSDAVRGELERNEYKVEQHVFSKEDNSYYYSVSW